MLRFFSKYKFLAVVLFALSIIVISIFYQILKPKIVLPVYQPAKVSTELVDSTIQHVKKYHRIDGKTVSQDDYKDKIYVADFFFTTCQTICPIMTDHMVIIQKQLKNDKEVLLLSHSVTPEIDSVTQLKKYALEKGVDDRKWNLVTGDKKQIYKLARKSYLAVKEDGDGGPHDMIHTENFILIDKKKRIRGFYDGTDRNEIDKLMEDIEILKRER
jgi:protein SCO1/2